MYLLIRSPLTSVLLVVTCTCQNVNRALCIVPACRQAVTKCIGRESHTLPEHHIYRTMDVKIIPALQDNYMYLLIDKNTNEAVAVDPVWPEIILKAVQDNRLNLTAVLTTHHHWDHSGGNEAIKYYLPNLPIYGGDTRIKGITDLVRDGDVLNVGNLDIECMYTPCHTSGDTCYYVTCPSDNGDCAVFTGDTLFLGGCGRLFEGSPVQMFKALRKLASLPPETKVYCGHEYTLQNVRYASVVEPNNEEIIRKMELYMNRREQGLPTVPSSIGEEMKYNPFMRVEKRSVMKHAGESNPIDAIKVLRLEKDNFTG